MQTLLESNKAHAGIDFCTLAAQYGYLSLLKWACAKGAQCSSLTYGGAATGGHITTMLPCDNQK